MNRLLSLALLLIASSAHADLDLTVSGGAVSAQPIAVVPFSQPAGGASPDIAQIVAADLERCGLFRPLPRTDMTFGLPTQESEVDYRTWRALNQDLLVVGRVQAMPNGGAKVNAELFDVARTSKLISIEASATRASDWRSMAHKVADQIYENLTHVRGIFDTRIAYVAVSMVNGKRLYRIIWADADGENPRDIARSYEPLLSPVWSPDGKRIAYVAYEGGRQKIVIQTPATGDFQTLLSEKGINSAPAWTPDGNKLVVTLSFETNPDLYVIDIATKARRRLTDSFAIDTAPTVSPDGSKVAFLSDRGGSAQIYIVPITGGEAKRLTFIGRRNEQPRFSPDGKSLALVNYDGSGYRIGLLDLASGSLKLVSDGPLDEGPSFAPNGYTLVYTRESPRGAELATVSVDGRIPPRSLPQTGDVREPAWSPYARP